MKKNNSAKELLQKLFEGTMMTENLEEQIEDIAKRADDDFRNAVCRIIGESGIRKTGRGYEKRLATALQYYEKYSPLCKQMNYSDDIYVSLLIEALLKYNQPPMSLFQSWEKIVFSANGFKAKSGRSSFRYLEEGAFVVTYLYPLEPVIPAGTENDELVYYPDEEIFYSQNYLKQVQTSKTVPQDYSNVQFKGKPCLLTDMYGFPAVFDDANMYYLEK